ncbi:hypothetical protein ABIE65_003624 [Constrictibacter sp. MBR-5]|jgi:hypothetical protein|uniref:YfhO family protein n=1 Tax=Constrictibacter sp. MBR-5 TaxID=3156467 RepID=UPI003392A00D
MHAPALASPDPLLRPTTCDWPLWASLASVAGIWAFLAWPWLVDGLIIPWDAKNHFYPLLRFVAQSLHDGQSPAWNPYHMGGYPMISDPQSMLFSPLMLGLAALVERPSMRMVDAAQLLHLLIGGIGIVLLCRSHRWIAPAGLLAATVYMFGGSAAARLQHTGIILSYGWLPLAFWLLKETVDRSEAGRRSVGWAAGFGLVAAVMAANRDQIAFLACMTMVAYVAHRAATAADLRAFANACWRPGLTAIATGIAVLALPVLLTLQFLGLSNRPEISFDLAITGSLNPVNFITALVPDYFKSLNGFSGYWGPGGLPWAERDWTDRATDYLYLGILPVVLVLRYGVLAGWLAAREVRFYAGVLVVMIFYAVGSHTPVFEFLYEAVPGVDLYRRPADATFLVGFALALCAGYLLHRLAAGDTGRLRRPALTIGAVAAVAATGFAGWLAWTHGELHWALLQMTEAALWIAVAAGIAALVARSGSGGHAALGLALTLLVLDLRLHNSGTVLNAHSPDTVATFEAPEGDVVAGVLQEYLSTAEERGGGPYRAEVIGLGGAWQNAPMVFDIESTLGYNPLRLEAYEEATGATESSHMSKRRFSKLMGSYRSTLANMLGIRFICTAAPIETLDPSLKPGDMRLVDQIGRVRIYENAGAMPRAMLVPRAIAADAEKILRSGVMPPLDYRATALIEDLPPSWTNPPPAGRAAAVGGRASIGGAPIGGAMAGSATVVDYSNTEVRVEVNAAQRSFLVLNDLWYPSWRAYVDGEERPIHRANVLFRAVEVPPGRHTVVFSFEPFALENLIAALVSVEDKVR